MKALESRKPPPPSHPLSLPPEQGLTLMTFWISPTWVFMIPGLCPCTVHQLDPTISALSHPYLSVVPSQMPEKDGPTFFLPRKARVAMSSPVCLPSAFLVAPCDDTAPAALRSSYNRERSQSAMFSLRRCVLCLPSQKARPIFTYHFDAISGCNGNWALSMEILTQNTKHWRELGGWTRGGLLPEASWQGWLWFLGWRCGQQVNVSLGRYFLLFQ